MQWDAGRTLIQDSRSNMSPHPVPQVRVDFPHKESLCSASKPGSPWRQRVAVPPMSSKMIPYVFIPLETGQVEVEVKVGGEARDHVRKTLLVRVIGELGVWRVI